MNVTSDALRQQLKWVKLPAGNICLDGFPDFLIIGPQRTGTTWLHANLRFHPQVMLSEPKELFFFSRLKTPDNPRFQSNQLEWYLRFFREPPARFLAKMALSLWKYRELYRPKVRGEATASYAAIDRDIIAEIAALNPDIKALLMIRNPIDRAWSHAKKDLARNTKRKIEDVPDDEFERFLSDDYQRRCAAYVENYDNWSAYLKPGNLFVGRFDDIEQQPELLLLDVMSFLGVKSDARYIPDDVRTSVNPTESSTIPEQRRRFLEELLKPDIAALKDRFGLSWP